MVHICFRSSTYGNETSVSDSRPFPWEEEAYLSKEVSSHGRTPSLRLTKSCKTSPNRREEEQGSGKIIPNRVNV